MRYRTLGGTGIEVSSHCLGTMMFGAVGNPDHDDCVRIIHAALDQGINFVDTADMYSAGESEEIVGKALQGPPRRRRARDQGALPDGRGPQPQRQLPALDHPRGRGQPAPARHRLDRPLPGAPAGPLDRHRGDTLGADRPGPRRARSARSAARPSRPRRSSRRTTSPSGAGYGRSGPSSRRTRCSAAGSSARVLPVVQRLRHGRADLEPARLRLPDRHVPQGPADRPHAPAGPPSPRTASIRRCPATRQATTPSSS